MSKLHSVPVETYLHPRMDADRGWVSGIKPNKSDAVVDLARSRIVVGDIEDYASSDVSVD